MFVVVALAVVGVIAVMAALFIRRSVTQGRSGAGQAQELPPLADNVLQLLKESLTEGAQTQTPVSLILMAVDGTGKPGDATFRKVSRTVRPWLANRSQRNRVSLYGARGLAIVLLDSDSAAVNTFSEKVREYVARRFPNRSGGARITASLGVTTWYPAQPADPAGLIAAADVALHVSQRAGGNSSSAIVYPIDPDHTLRLSAAVRLSALKA